MRCMLIHPQLSNAGFLAPTGSCGKVIATEFACDLLGNVTDQSIHLVQLDTEDRDRRLWILAEHLHVEEN